MQFDIFFSICQTRVDGFLPSERQMFENFFDQVQHADTLNFGTAWLAETHLSCQTQKENPGAVIPHFEGEIGLNTDILQMAHIIFERTQNLNVGSAIRNILCNGGPIAHAEAIRTFLSLHSLRPNETRKLDLGFASGRFPFSNTPYGIRPRNAVEEAAWPVLKGKIFMEAIEIFLRLLKGEQLSSRDVTPKVIKPDDFRTPDEWQKVLEAMDHHSDTVEIASTWVFDKVGVIPFDAPLDLLRLTIGSHDPKAQDFANTIMPAGVFNLSITPNKTIEETHARMTQNFHPDGGPWTRTHMPRTVLVFVDTNEINASKTAQSAIANYWKAVQGTLDQAKVDAAVNNALVGTPEQVIEQMQERFHPEDRLMLWFDFNNHNNQEIKDNMSRFMEEVAPTFK